MKKESKRHILSTVAIILAAVAAVTVLFVLHHKQQQEKARQPEESVSQAEDDTIEWNGKRYTYNNNLINILFLGIDHANDIDTSYMPGDAGQADCIMLLSLDKETKEGRILQINRNTMTQIDTYDSTGSAFGTVNAQLATQYAYCIGGSRSCWATEKTVKKLLYNLPISGYFALSVDGIPEINDALGGVTVEMTEEDAAINPAFEAGKEVCLKGADAENYVRYRDTNAFNSNEGRMQRQVKYRQSKRSCKYGMAIAGIILQIYKKGENHEENRCFINDCCNDHRYGNRCVRRTKPAADNRYYRCRQKCEWPGCGSVQSQNI